MPNRARLQVLGFGIIAWGNVYRLFPGQLAFGLTPFLVVYTLTQLVGHNTWESTCKFTVSLEPNIPLLAVMLSGCR